jgi:hypothetical protein
MGWKRKALRQTPEISEEHSLRVFTVTGSVVVVKPEDGIRDVSIKIGAESRRGVFASIAALLRRLLRA